MVAEQLREAGISGAQILLEPKGRNSALAIAAFGLCRVAVLVTSVEFADLWSLFLDSRGRHFLNDVDILVPLDRQRVRTAQEKAALLAEVDAKGGKVRLVAA